MADCDPDVGGNNSETRKAGLELHGQSTTSWQQWSKFGGDDLVKKQQQNKPGSDLKDAVFHCGFVFIHNHNLNSCL